jgi:cell shape-determining protein MreD
MPEVSKGRRMKFLAIMAMLAAIAAAVMGVTHGQPMEAAVFSFIAGVMLPFVVITLDSPEE